MISSGRSHKIPYGVLFGGDRYIMFTICPVPGTDQYGLICSDILNLFDQDLPFMLIMVFCLLGACYGPQGPILLGLPTDITIPHVPIHAPLGRTRQGACYGPLL